MVTLAMKQETWILVLILLLSCVSLDRFFTLLRLNFFICKMKKQPSPLTNSWKLHFTIALFHCFCWNTRRQKWCYYPSPLFLNYTWVNQASGRWVIFCQRAYSWDALSSIFPLLPTLPPRVVGTIQGYLGLVAPGEAASLLLKSEEREAGVMDLPLWAPAGKAILFSAKRTSLILNPGSPHSTPLSPGTPCHSNPHSGRILSHGAPSISRSGQPGAELHSWAGPGKGSQEEPLCSAMSTADGGSCAKQRERGVQLRWTPEGSSVSLWECRRPPAA